MTVHTCLHCELRFSYRAEMVQHLVSDHPERVPGHAPLPSLVRTPALV